MYEFIIVERYIKIFAVLSFSLKPYLDCTSFTWDGGVVV